MKKLLFAMFVALVMVGCGEKPEEDSPESNQSAAETPQLKSPEIAKIDLEDNENDLVLLYTPNLLEEETVSFSGV